MSKYYFLQIFQKIILLRRLMVLSAVLLFIFYLFFLGMTYIQVHRQMTYENEIDFTREELAKLEAAYVSMENSLTKETAFALGLIAKPVQTTYVQKTRRVSSLASSYAAGEL